MTRTHSHTHVASATYFNTIQWVISKVQGYTNSNRFDHIKGDRDHAVTIYVRNIVPKAVGKLRVKDAYELFDWLSNNPRGVKWQYNNTDKVHYLTTYLTECTLLELAKLYA